MSATTMNIVTPPLQSRRLSPGLPSTTTTLSATCSNSISSSSNSSSSNTAPVAPLVSSLRNPSIHTTTPLSAAAFDEHHPVEISPLRQMEGCFSSPRGSSKPAATVTWGKTCFAQDSSSHHRSNGGDDDDTFQSEDDQEGLDLDQESVSEDDDDDDDDGSVSVSSSSDEDNVSESDEDGMDLFDRMYASYSSTTQEEMGLDSTTTTELDDSYHITKGSKSSGGSSSKKSSTSKSGSNQHEDTTSCNNDNNTSKNQNDSNDNDDDDEEEDPTIYEYDVTNEIQEQQYTEFIRKHGKNFPPTPEERMIRKQRSFHRRNGYVHNALLKSAVMCAMESTNDDETNDPNSFRNRRGSILSTNSGVSLQSLQEGLMKQNSFSSPRKRARRTASRTMLSPRRSAEDAAEIQNASSMFETLCVGSNNAKAPSRQRDDEIGGFVRAPPIRRVSRKKSYDSCISDDLDSEDLWDDESSF